MAALHLLHFVLAVAVEGCPSNFEMICTTPVVHELIAVMSDDEGAS